MSRDLNNQKLEENMLEDHLNPPAVTIKTVLDGVGMPEKKQKEIIKLVADLEKESKTWESLAKLTIEDPEDIETIKLAKENRLKIKNKRLEATKFLKAQRELVQEKMKEFTIEDKALLKLAQFYEEKADAFETHLSSIEKFAETYAEEQKKKLREERLEKLKDVCEDPDMYPVESMSEAAFNSLYEGLKLTKEKEEHEKEAAEAAEALYTQRIHLLRENDLADYLEEEEKQSIVGLTQSQFDILVESAKERKEESDRQAEEARIQRKKHDSYRDRITTLAGYVLFEYEGRGTVTIDTTEEQFQTIFAAAKKAREAHDATVAENNRQEQIKQKLFGFGLTFDGKHFTLNRGEDVPIVLDWSIVVEMTPEKLASSYKSLEDQVRIIASKKSATVTSSSSSSFTPSTSEVVTPEVIISTWVEEFKSPAFVDSKNINVEEIRKEILNKFDGFVKWALKQVPKKS